MIGKLSDVIIVLLWALGMVAIWFDHSVAMLLWSYPAGVSAGRAFYSLRDEPKKSEE